MKDMDVKDLITLLVTVFLPPLGVAVKFGIGLKFLLNLALTLFGYVPGLIHGVYVVLKG